MRKVKRRHGGTDETAGGRRLVRASVALCLAVALTGCVYYNGVYNAEHWAAQAERSERAGRGLEAADRWRIAQVHAESVIARHPNSSWVGDAYLIKGRSLVALESWGDAIVALQEADHRLPNLEPRREAELLIGRAYFGLARAADALSALDSALTSSRGLTRSL